MLQTKVCRPAALKYSKTYALLCMLTAHANRSAAAKSVQIPKRRATRLVTEKKKKKVLQIKSFPVSIVDPEKMAE